MVFLRCSAGLRLAVKLALSVSLLTASPSLASAATARTGGISLEHKEQHWPAPHHGLPHVVMTSSGFTITTAQGRTFKVPSDDTARDRFLTLWLQLHDPRNGYFSATDLPYHSAETLIVEAPDYGHLTTSETISYWAWLEAVYSRYTGDFSLLGYVYDRMEAYAVPKMQHGVGSYNPSSPAQYAPERDLPNEYPVQLNQGVQVGTDPIAKELAAAHGPEIYGMHWLIDTDNWYGYGHGTNPVPINTFQRGAMESVFLTVPHPSFDEFHFGAPDQGFLSLFAADPSGYKRQWRYTNAPDADARMVQATYIAMQAARASGDEQAVRSLAAKASKMGDYLRYSMFDKYFKATGCMRPDCTPGQGYDAAHYLMAWYYSWGGSHPQDQGSWSWRIGGSHAHFGYQNPFAAYILSQDQDFLPLSAHGAADWHQSLTRQLEFYQWLQAAEGAIAGGATNSWLGRYETPPAGQSQFYGLSFEPHPVYHNPNSNSWFGWQAWSMERVATYYQVSGDRSVEPLLTRWVNWVTAHVKLQDDGGYLIPSTLEWSGQPDSWDPQVPDHQRNRALHVRVTEYAEDVGIGTSLAKALASYAKGSRLHRQVESIQAATLAQELIDRTWNHYRDDKGVTNNETRADYKNFNAGVYIPPGYQGKLAHGAEAISNATFLSLRPQYRQDNEFSKVQNYLNGGPAPIFRYHRFWAEVEAAVAFAN
ncbi:MAG: endoglucanase [Deltaproteobacteria bacterium]|nr:endoglucanase [Deltaproteobacteria bacterium]